MNRLVALFFTFYLMIFHSFSQDFGRSNKFVINTKSSFNSICNDLNLKLNLSDPVINGDNDFIHYKRWEWYWGNRLTEDGFLPSFELVSFNTNQVLGLQNRSQDHIWKNIGPNVNSAGYWGAGRVTDIAFHPSDTNVFFVGAAKGGIWKTVNGGLSYFSLGDDLPYNSVSNIVLNPFNSNEIYISLGDNYQWTDFGIGVYKSLDGGASWVPTNFNYQIDEHIAFYDMKGSPFVEDLLLVSTGDGLFRSDDGFTFNQITAGLPYSINSGSTPDEIVFHPSDSNIIYLSWWDYSGENLDLFKSVDKGVSWQNVTNFDLTTYGGISVAVTKANVDKVVLQVVSGDNRFISYSIDAGENWVNQANVSILENSPLALSPIDENKIYSGSFYIKQSSDNGATFENFAAWDLNFVHVDQQVIVVNPLNNKLYWGNDGGVYSFDEANSMWVELNNGLSIRQVYRASVSQNKEGAYYFGSQDNGGGYTDDDGYSWLDINGGDVMSNVTDPLNGDIMYSTFPMGDRLVKTNDAWETTIDMEAGLSAFLHQASWITPLDLSSSDRNFLITGSSELFISSNYGDEWSQLTSGETEGDVFVDVKFSPNNKESIYAITNDKLVSTSDGGGSWVVQEFDNMRFCRVVPNPRNEDEFWLVNSGYSENKKVFHSTDRGQTLQNISYNLPNIPIHTLCFDTASNKIYLGSEFGVLVLNDDFNSWSYFGLGLPKTAVTDLDIQESSRTLVASTYGRGLWGIDISVEEVFATEEDDGSNDESTSTPELNLIEVKFYPNPVKADLIIEFKESYQGKFIISDTDGKEVQSKNFTGSTIEITLGDLSSGVYTVYLFNEHNQLISSQKFVKD
jgi:photosystem II stability/assembly factor-like uncharacterized protein